MNERTTFWTDGGSLWLPPQSSTTAGEIDLVFNFILWTSVLLTIGVTIGVVYLAWKYRRRTHAERPVPVKESKTLELAWSVIPTILVLIVFFLGFRAYVGTSIPPTDAYEIYVKGQKWFWTFEYPDGRVTQSELTVPAGQPVKLIMTSQDVIHSFFVPEFRIKMDVLPNRYTYVWFEAPAEGTYQVVCTEYCGRDHSNMGAKIHVVGRDEFYAFLQSAEAGADLPLNELGAQVYSARACNACHSLDGSQMVGPSWAGTWGEPRPGSASGVVDETYVRESILNPGAYVVPGFQNQMPPYEGVVSDREILGVIAYMQELSGIAPTEAPEAEGAAVPDPDTTAAIDEGGGDPSAPAGLDAGQ